MFMRHQSHRLDERLRDPKAVKRVLMMAGVGARRRRDQGILPGPEELYESLRQRCHP